MPFVGAAWQGDAESAMEWPLIPPIAWASGPRSAVAGTVVGRKLGGEVRNLAGTAQAVGVHEP